MESGSQFKVSFENCRGLGSNLRPVVQQSRTRDNFGRGHGQKFPFIFKMAPTFHKHESVLLCKEIGNDVSM